jgi:hypothetical protein
MLALTFRANCCAYVTARVLHLHRYRAPGFHKFPVADNEAKLNFVLPGVFTVAIDPMTLFSRKAKFLLGG